MNLKEAIKEALEHNDEESFLMIYAQRIKGQWMPSSRAVLVALPNTCDFEPPTPDGMEYFLESFVAQEVLEFKDEFAGDPAFDQIVNLIINYAEYDCYPDPEEGWDFKVYNR